MTKNTLNNFYFWLVTGNQKAIVAFLVSAALSGLAQVGLSGELTLKEALTSVAVGAVTHASVWFKANVK